MKCQMYETVLPLLITVHGHRVRFTLLKIKSSLFFVKLCENLYKIGLKTIKYINGVTQKAYISYKVVKPIDYLRYCHKMSEPTEPNSNSNQSATENGNKEKDPGRPKLKILAFHGYRQNGTVFRSKIGSFRKAVSKYAQLTFISAPHRVLNEEGGGDEDGRSWWFNAEDNTFSGKCLGGPALGFEETLSLVERTVNEYGPFDGFMGFSQGACLVGLLAAIQQKGYLRFTFKFAIFASGFRSGSLVHKGFYDEDITLPSLHVYGESDSIIPKEMSESLINLFINPIVAEHSGGHYVACSGSTKEAYLDFLHERYQDIIENVAAEDGPNT